MCICIYVSCSCVFTPNCVSFTRFGVCQQLHSRRLYVYFGVLVTAKNDRHQKKAALQTSDNCLFFFHFKRTMVFLCFEAVNASNQTFRPYSLAFKISINVNSNQYDCKIKDLRKCVNGHVISMGGPFPELHLYLHNYWYGKKQLCSKHWGTEAILCYAVAPIGLSLQSVFHWCSSLQKLQQLQRNFGN